MFDVGALLEDAETKNTLLEHVEELQEHNTQVSVHTQTHRSGDSLCDGAGVKMCVGVSAELQVAGERKGDDGEGLWIGEEAHSDVQRGGAPQGRVPLPSHLHFTSSLR